MVLEQAELMAFVPVRDVARARAFYEGVLGCAVLAADDYGCQLGWQGRPMRLAVVEGELPAFTVLGWMVPSMEEAVRSLAGAAGVEFTRYEGMGQDDLGVWTAPSGDRVAWFADSEGNTLSLTQSR
jgi:catechol 2,3-dioxygenase-like lactoylglutathione lyase family enzyme